MAQHRVTKNLTFVFLGAGVGPRTSACYSALPLNYAPRHTSSPIFLEDISRFKVEDAYSVPYSFLGLEKDCMSGDHLLSQVQNCSGGLENS